MFANKLDIKANRWPWEGEVTIPTEGYRGG